MICRSARSRTRDASYTARIISAPSMAARLLLIPSASTRSWASLMPAVSMIRTGIPSIFRPSSIISLVVPGRSVTIARSFLRSVLRRDDLPTFGFPTIAIAAPSRNNLPSSKLRLSAERRSRMSCIEEIKPALSGSSTSSSGKSMYASTSAHDSATLSLKAVISADSLPSSCCIAILSACSVLAFITSMTASAWDRSTRPLRKARLVNSPGSAGLAPRLITEPRMRLRGSMPP